MDEIKITLEGLYDILRNEKKKEDLQKLSPSFHIDVVSYLREKKSLLDAQSSSADLFAATEKDKLEYELRSINRILKEIYEKREKKIIDITLNKSRTGSDIIDTSAMLREEKEFYTQLLSLFDVYRKGVLLKLFNAQVPFIEVIKSVVKNVDPLERIPVTPLTSKEKSDTEQISKKNSFSEFEGVESSQEKEDQEDDSLEKNELDSSADEFEEDEGQEDQTTEKSESTKITIKFIKAVPRFIWKDMKEYGPFNQGEETDIFEDLADLLVRKGRAEKVS
jgi:hypothetical protein